MNTFRSLSLVAILIFTSMVGGVGSPTWAQESAAGTGRWVVIQAPTPVFDTIGADVGLAGPAERYRVVHEEEGGRAPRPAFAVSGDPFWGYVERQGGVATLGEPISRPFVLRGRTSQLFERALLQSADDGSVAMGDVLGDGLAGLRRAGGMALPSVDEGLVATHPAPGAPDYAERAMALVAGVVATHPAPGAPDYAERAMALVASEVPDSFDGAPINFRAVYSASALAPSGSSAVESAPRAPALRAIELWGLPTSRPVRDPADSAVVLQRFARAVLRFSPESGATFVPLGIVLRDVMLGVDASVEPIVDAPPNVFFGQYDGQAGRGPLRPETLPETTLDGAFLPGRIGDARFGVVMTGAKRSADATYMAAALDALGATSWFAYDGSMGVTGEQAGLIRPGPNLDLVVQQAAKEPGAVWLIGNEPNVPGQDDVSPARFADFLHQVATAIRGADPTAILVGPNVLNWRRTCVNCPGYPSGESWSAAFLADYQERYGPLPLDAWGMHTYSLDWTRLPLADAPADREQLADARRWLETRGLGLPIWLTEFGVIWAYDDLAWVTRPDGTAVAEPRGTFREDLIAAYLDSMYSWLTTSGAELRIERWFLYGSSPPPEPYASLPTTIALIAPDGPALTALGQRHRAWALGALTAGNR